MISAGLQGLGDWSQDPLWAHVYDWIVEHPTPGRLIWRAGLGSDLSRLHRAIGEVGRQPAGAAILDVPCGGGVALRALRPGQGVRYVAADISMAMLRRTEQAAHALGVEDQVSTQLADVTRLPFADAEFDLVASFTSLHCFDDPHAAVLELARVTAHGGTLTGSALLNDTGLRYEHLRISGRLAGLLGPGCTSAQLRTWLEQAGMSEVVLRISGALCYFRATRP